MDISIQVTVPKNILRMSIVQDSIAQVMTKKTAPEVKTLFRKTVYGWKNKPTFRQKHEKRANYMSETIWADGSNADQYQMVNYGTKPHLITIRKFGKLLTFRWGGVGSYKASSTPRIIQSKRHSQSGGIAKFFAVDHPGFPAREFDKTIADYYEPIFRQDIADAIGVAAAKSAQENA